MNGKGEEQGPKKLLELFQQGEDLVMVVKNLDEEKRQQAIQMMLDFCVRQEKKPETLRTTQYTQEEKIINDQYRKCLPNQNSSEKSQRDINECDWQRLCYGNLQSRDNTRRFICNLLNNEYPCECASPNPILVSVANLAKEGEWIGTPTELFNKIPQDFKMPHFLTRYLNSKVKEMFYDYGILYQSGRNSKGRYVYVRRADTTDREIIKKLEREVDLVSKAFRM